MLLLNDGATHTITDWEQNVVVKGGSTLHISAGAAISGEPNGFTSPRGTAGVTAGSGSTLSITGGVVSCGTVGGAALATVVSGAVTAVTVTDGGNGYPPDDVPNKDFVTLTGGGGGGATATATVPTSGANSGKITGVTVTNGGTGYTSAPTVTFPVGRVFGGGTAAATATVASGAVTAINVTSPGFGYPPDDAPNYVSFDGGHPTRAAVATATVAGGVITGFVVDDGGAGYTSTPTVILSADAGSGFSVLAYGSDVTISGGTFTAPLQLGGGLYSTDGTTFLGRTGVIAISGGTFRATPGNPDPNVSVACGGGDGITISGGTFGAGYPGRLKYGGSLRVCGQHGAGTMTVSGGTYAGAIFVDLVAGTLTFTGTGLAYTGGVLSGTLSDSSSINALVVLEQGSLVSASSTAVVFGP